MDDDTSEAIFEAREARFLRGAREVRAKYELTARAAEKDGTRAFDVKGGDKPYVVTAHPAWAATPTCSCPDARRGARDYGGYCKHVIAVLLSDDALRCQLLEILL